MKLHVLMESFSSLGVMPLALGLCVFVVTSAPAQVSLDGSLLNDNYGTPLSIQNTNTDFGDALLGDQVADVEPGGNELDAFYAKIESGRLYMFVAGNLNRDFTKLEFFFDTRAGGHNTLDGTMLPTGVDEFAGGGGALQRMNGLTFDAGFEADYYLTFNHGPENVGDPITPGQDIGFWAASAHYSDMTIGAAVDKQDVAAGMVLAPNGLPNVLRIPTAPDISDPPYVPWLGSYLDFGTTNPNLIGPTLPGLAQGELIDRNYALNNGGCVDDTGAGCITPELGFALDQSPTDPSNELSHRNFNNVIDLQMAMDNSNFFGVDDTAPFATPTTTDPAAVTTGFEFSIPLSEIGNPNGDFKVVAFINGTVHDYLSNQVAGDGILRGNLGGDGMGNGCGTLTCNGNSPNFETIPGDQFVTIPYTPPTVSCDFDGSGSCDGADIDALVANIAVGPPDPGTYDLTNDGLVNLADRDAWLTQAGALNLPSQNAYLLGDANLDGTVDGQDFIRWNSNKFTNTIQWTSGNFTADGAVDGQDFILWNANKFQTADGISAVPEPASAGLAVLCMVLLSRRGRRA